MRQPFNCVICGKEVDPTTAHPACRYTCGNAQCQTLYHRQYAVRIDQRKQRDRINSLQLQGTDLVTCAICNQQFEIINYHHLKIHGLSLEDYKRLYPGSPTLNSRMKQTRGKGALNQAHYLTYDGKEVDQKLYEFLIGSLLGDGHFEKNLQKCNARYAEGGSNQQYLEWKYQFLSQYFSCRFNERLSAPHTKTGKQYQGWWIKTAIHPIFTTYHSLWYSKKKIISEELVLKYLTEFALVVWFCDDGCSTNTIAFYTMAFSEKEVKFLAKLLASRFGLNSYLLKNKNNQLILRLDADSKQRFRKITHQYSIPGMDYKLKF